MVNPDEIRGFLQTINRGHSSNTEYDDVVYGNDQGGHTAGPSAPRSFTHSQTHSSSEYSYSRASQPCEIASDASTVNYTMTPSIFSYQSGKSRSSAGNTSAPSVHLGQQTFDQFVIAGPGPNQARGDLWCEFSELFGCSATFQLNDTEGWIQHHLGHLNNRCPLQSTCWFCDDRPFRTDVEPYATFWDRMEHIHSHILYDRLTSNHVRPDFHMLKHLYNMDLISFDLYQYARNYNELPQSLQCPGSNTSSPMPANQHFESRDQVHVCPMSKEEKRQLRRYKEKSSGRSKH